MSKLKLFVQNLIQEVRYNITWPTYDALQSNAVLVLIVSFVFALFVGLIDWSFKQVFIWFYATF